MAPLLGRLAAAAAGHWKRSLALAAAVLIALGVLAGTVGGDFADDFGTPGSESQQALDLLTQRFPAQSGDTATMVFAVENGTLREGPRAAAIERTARTIERQPHVTGVAPVGLSRNAPMGFLPVQYDNPGQVLQKPRGERLADVPLIGERAGIEVSRR